MTDYPDELDNAYPFPQEKVISAQKVEGFSRLPQIQTFPSTFWVSFWLFMIFSEVFVLLGYLVYMFLTKDISIITYVGTNPIKP